MSCACPAAHSNSAVLPMPGSPRSTSTPLSPSRTAAKTPSTAAVSAALSSNSVIGQPSRRPSATSQATPARAQLTRRRTTHHHPHPAPATSSFQPQLGPDSDIGAGDVTLEGLGSGGQEERVVAAPDGQQRWLAGPEVVLELGIQLDVACVVKEEVQLNLVRAG